MTTTAYVVFGLSGTTGCNSMLESGSYAVAVICAGRASRSLYSRTITPFGYPPLSTTTGRLKRMRIGVKVPKPSNAVSCAAVFVAERCGPGCISLPGGSDAAR